MVLLTHLLLVLGLAKLECSCLHLNDVNVVLLIYLLPQQDFGESSKALDLHVFEGCSRGLLTHPLFK